MFGCGGGSDDNLSLGPSETGSASFTVAWHDTPVIQASENNYIPMIDCDGAGVSTITFEVYDESNTYLTSGSFECSSGQGTIDNIPAGTNREVVILGEDVNGNILYHGITTGITVTAGQINDAGIIDTHPFYVSDLLAPEDGSLVTIDKFSLNWISVETAYKYRIQISKDIDFENIVVDVTTADTSYTPLGLLEESSTYYWRVYAFDIHANQSAGSSILKFTVIPVGQCTYSISPTSSSFPSGGGEGSINVTSSADGCSWTVSESVNWISITSGSNGSDNGMVTYTVSVNTDTSKRTAAITIAGKSHTVSQDGGDDAIIVESLREVVDALQVIVDSNPGTPLSNKLRDAIARIEKALDKLNNLDNKGAVGELKSAVDKLEAAVKDEGLDPVEGKHFMDQLASAARQLAKDAINMAIYHGGDAVKIEEAQSYLTKGDAKIAQAVALIANGDWKEAMEKSLYEKAVGDYEDAIAKAESSIS